MKNTICYIGLLLFCVCAGKKMPAGSTVAEAERTIDSTFTGTCPYLFQSGDTLAIFSWVRTVSGSKPALCYRVSKGGAFSKTITVPGSDKVKPHGENLPKVIVAPDGRVIAAWGVANPNPQNPYSGLIYYSSSADGGQTWTAPAPLSPDQNSIDQRYFDFEILPDRSVGAVWLDARKNTEREGSSLYFAIFTRNNVFEGEKAIDETVCQCCRTDLFTDNKGGLHVAYRKILNDSIRDMVHIVSKDNGRTFSAPVRISPDNWVINGCPHTGPAIAQTSSGLSFVWYTMGSGKGVFYASSKDNGQTFSSKNAVGTSTAGKHPQILVLKNGNQAIVWDERTEDGSRIGLEIRTPAGKKIRTRYLTSRAGFASFPVIELVGKDVLVAYSGSVTAEDQERVYFQKVNVE